MNKDAMDWSTSSYIADTTHFSLAQHGAYCLILMAMWRAGGSLADDDQQLANICRTTVAKWRHVAPAIRAILLVEDGRLSQKRLKNDYGKMKKAVAASVENGRAGGIAKSLKIKNPSSPRPKRPPAVRQPSATPPPENDANALSSLLSKTQDSDLEKKKDRNSAGTRLPVDWVPSVSLIGYGGGLGLTKAEVLSMAEDLRLWAVANANRPVARKADWEKTFQGWMRREAPKVLRQRNGGSYGTNQRGPNAGPSYGEISAGLRARRTARESAGGVLPVDGPGASQPSLDLMETKGR